MGCWTNDMQGRGNIVAGLLVAGALLAGIPATGFAGSLEISVKAPWGKAAPPGRLIVLDRELPIPAAGEKILVKDLPDRRIAVSVDAQSVKAGAKGAVRYIGVGDVTTVPSATVAVEVVVAEVKEIDPFCSGCHPAKGMPVKADQIVRDVHVTGKELTGKYLEQVQAHNKKVQTKLKNKEPNPPLPIVLEERIVKVAGKEVKKQFFTCESCHTVHLKTPWLRYMRAGFERSNDLCVGCHY